MKANRLTQLIHLVQSITFSANLIHFLRSPLAAKIFLIHRTLFLLGTPTHQRNRKSTNSLF